MKVHCPICCAEIDGMRAYGAKARCCGKECYDEWTWRETLAIMGKTYYPRPPKDASMPAGLLHPENPNYSNARQQTEKKP